MYGVRVLIKRQCLEIHSEFTQTLVEDTTFYRCGTDTLVDTKGTVINLLTTAITSLSFSKYEF